MLVARAAGQQTPHFVRCCVGTTKQISQSGPPKAPRLLRKRVQLNKPEFSTRIHDPATYKKRLLERWNNGASEYDEAAEIYFGLAEQLVQLAEPQLGENVLDVGTGTGWVGLLMADAVGPEGRVIGLDLCPAMLEQAEAKAAANDIANFMGMVGDVEEMRFAKGVFDKIVCSCAMHYVMDHLATFKKFHKWLAPNGAVVLNSFQAPQYPEYGIFSSLLKSAYGIELVDSLTPVGDEDKLYLTLQAAGFTTVETWVSEEKVTYPTSPEDYAEGMWDICINMPMAAAVDLVPAEKLDRLRPRFLSRVERMCSHWIVEEGLEVPSTTIWAHASR